MSRSARPLLLLFLLVVLPGAVASARAQEAASPTADRSDAGDALVVLPADHWAVAAAGRLEARGLAPGFLPAQRSVPLAAVRAAFREAAAEAPDRAPEMSAAIGAWRARLDEEFPEGAGRTEGFLAVPAASAELAYRRYGPGPFDPASGPRNSLLDRTVGEVEPFARTSAAVVVGGHLVLAAEPRVTPEGAALEEWEAAVGWRGLALSVGRGPVGYGPGKGGGVVLSGGVPLERVQLQTTHPVRLPGPLRHVGPVAFHASLARFPGATPHRDDPFFWSASVAARPHPRLTLALHRAALFGGKDAPAPAGLDDFLWMVLGPYNPSGSQFENQIVSASVRYRLPSERVVPLVAYAEWGTDDAAGGMDEAPGIVAGLRAPALPGLPQLSVGVERAWFGVRCCRKLRWYNHSELYYGAGGFPLGHPLAGNGDEWLIHASGDLLDARLRVDGRGFVRRREPVTLFGSAREGRSAGFEGSVAWRIGAGADLRATVAREYGDGWRAVDGRVGLRVFF